MSILRAPKSLFPAGALLVIGMLLADITCAQTGDSLAGLRLFLSVQDRTRLDSKRREMDEVVVPPIVVEQPKPKPQPERKRPPRSMPRIELQGYVSRGDGENTLWINGRVVDKDQVVGSKLHLMSIDREDGEVRIEMPNKSVIGLKPGQRFEPKTKKIVDLLD